MMFPGRSPHGRFARLAPLLAAMFWLVCGSSAFAENSIKASLDPPSPARGDTFDYVLEIEGPATRVLRPEPSDLEGPIAYTSSLERNTSVINGRRITTYRFSLIARETGEFRLPPARAVFGSSILNSNVVSGTIVEPQEVEKDDEEVILPGAPRIVGYSNAEALNEQLEGKFFADVQVPEEMFVFQPVTVETYVYRKEDGYQWLRGPRAADARDLDSLGGGDAFLVLRDASEETNSRRAERVMINGEAWRSVLAYRTTVVPTRPGNFELKGATLAIDLPLSNSFNSVQAVFPQPSKQVTVRPVPAKPRDAVEQLVGNVTVSASVDRSDVNEGDLVTLRVRLSGAAFLQLADLGDLPDIPGLDLISEEVDFKINQPFPSLISTKTFDLVFQTNRAGMIEIPALKFGAFDPERGTQTVLGTKAIELNVQPRSSGAISLSGPGAAPAAPRGEARSLGAEGILFIDTAPLKASSVKAGNRIPVSRKWWFWGLQGAVLLGVLGFFGVQERTRAIDRDPAKRHAAACRSRSEADLKTAAATVDGGEPDAFYSALASGLRHAVAAATGREAAGLTAEDAGEELRTHGLPGELARRCAKLLERCDAIRYAPEPSGEARRNDLEEARAIVAATTSGGAAA